MKDSIIVGAAMALPNLNINNSTEYYKNGEHDKHIRKQRSIENAITRLRSQQALDKKIKKDRKLNRDLSDLWIVYMITSFDYI